MNVINGSSYSRPHAGSSWVSLSAFTSIVSTDVYDFGECTDFFKSAYLVSI
jgi:hypothetical protein